jgi:ribonuclease BN (tRNA processing enzyme)
MGQSRLLLLHLSEPVKLFQVGHLAAKFMIDVALREGYPVQHQKNRLHEFVREGGHCMPARLVPLGINGFIPSFGRQTMSFLLLTGKEALLLDAGTGVGRLLEPTIIDLLQPYNCLNILLSHYHLDHVVGLSYLPGTWMRGVIRIYAPGRPFVETEPDQALGQLLKPPLFPRRFADFPAYVEVVPMKSGFLEIGGMSIQLQGQNHPGGSVGVRVGNAIAYVTDTPVAQTTQTFVQGVRLLLHEVWLTDEEARQDEVEREKHSYVSGVAQIAKRAKVGSLMAIHHHPKRLYEEIQKLGQEMEALAGVKVIVPEEGRVYPLSGC